MNTSEIENLQNELFTENIKRMHPQSRQTLLAEISALEKDKKADEKAKQYLKWVSKQTEFNYYLALLPKGNGLILLKQNLKGAIVLGLNRPNEKLQPFFEGHHLILELLNIHSMQKGEGYKMMQKVISLSKKLDSPICLWAETEEIVQYFERYGFENYGALGENNECMMVFHND
ncbi:hypothetical protein [Niallia endozanthoxylica]|uniref:N-acetyltransferase domain-containing protein n=1 Tax=Niallia endozanthoxylica TaxID=2036016 RepID=A0A5J5HPN7_9BACI|nr:hypothetical protein [Niallia endozanthoxylica]KAA9022914.1 hypothetical protein F4V44_14325 [Niallia endozanthoxylica]